MTKQEILSLMMREENRVINADLYSLTAELAAAVAEASSQLDHATVARFVRVGAALYAHGLDEFKNPVRVEDLFPARENWPGPCPGRAGFRKRR